jgi:hypothetical protein
MCKHSRLRGPIIVALLVFVLASPSTLASSTTPAASPRPALLLAGNCAVNSPDTTAASSTGIVINEVMFYPGDGNSEWVELKNTGSAIDISGYSITDEDGNRYRIPDALPAVPAGGFVVIVFDGLGSGADDYDFGDNVATLHSPPSLVNILEDNGDQVALYAVSHFVYLPIAMREYTGPTPPTQSSFAAFVPPPIVSFVAWGADPADDAANASKAGIWNPAWFVSVSRGLGTVSSDESPVPDETVGLLPESQSGYLANWTHYLAGQVTKGSENELPVTSWFYPAPGATIDGATFAISWNPVETATGYRFQMDDSSDFGSPIVDMPLAEAGYIPPTPVAEGTYYWRVKATFVGGESPWSPGVQVRSLTVPTVSSAGMVALTSQTLGITWKLQRKDTNMLCLDGDQETGDSAWDRPHTDIGAHGSNYCVRASVSMLASYYGGQLSQDRISYEIFKGGEPEGDLGHAHPVGNVGQIDAAVSWALGTTVTRHTGKPPYQQIKDWIDAGQPIGSRIPGHMRMIDGYKEYTVTVPTTETIQLIHVLDPWDREKWVSYADDNITHVWVGPAGTTGAPGVKSDEDANGNGIPDTMDDSDGDGISDFDEIKRFQLNPNNPDSDGDLVPDKLDMREYLFGNVGNYTWRDPDIDGDGQRKERDPDNDNAWNNGSSDGCEDSNLNGRLDPGETSNFDPSQNQEKQCDTWNFYETGSTAGCVGTYPGSQGNGPYQSRFSLRVPQNPNLVAGAGSCSDGNPIGIGGTASGTTVEFLRFGPGCTPGYTVLWSYSGVVQGQKINGTFSGGGDPQDSYAEGCLTSGTFVVTK